MNEAPILDSCARVWIARGLRAPRRHRALSSMAVASGPIGDARSHAPGAALSPFRSRRLMTPNWNEGVATTGVKRGRCGMRTCLLTALAMVAFAANSLLARSALADASIDPASFTTVRLAAGAVTLWAIVAITRKGRLPKQGDWLSAFILCAFAVAFSLAYASLTVGTGALILFSTVQLTMLIVGRRDGEMFAPRAWIGFTLAMTGFVYLLPPGLAAPPPAGAMLMAVAGIAWGFYCLRGRTAADPLRANAGNFVRAVPLALLVTVLSLAHIGLSWRGTMLAVASGAIASGLGFVAWYAALARLTATRAATVQLSVPVLAACAGVVLLAEPLAWRLPLASLAILGGIMLVLSQPASEPRLTTKGELS